MFPRGKLISVSRNVIKWNGTNDVQGFASSDMMASGDERRPGEVLTCDLAFTNQTSGFRDLPSHSVMPSFYGPTNQIAFVFEWANENAHFTHSPTGTVERIPLLAIILTMFLKRSRHFKQLRLLLLYLGSSMVLNL